MLLLLPGGWVARLPAAAAGAAGGAAGLWLGAGAGGLSWLCSAAGGSTCSAHHAPPHLYRPTCIAAVKSVLSEYRIHNADVHLKQVGLWV